MQTAPRFVTGQRWISEPEPELGLGKVVAVENRKVALSFPGAEGLRWYTETVTILARVEFKIGDEIRNDAGASMRVEAVEERGGLIFYQGGGDEWSEVDLSDQLRFSHPEERLKVGQVDAPGEFALRVEALRQRERLGRLPVRGFLGARVDLIPHQLYIASEVSNRFAPRVMLADEVGLGKTIEAGLILHRLLLTGRVRRCLIVVPDSLIHQWFVEMLRRFNLWFSIVDAERLGESVHRDTGNAFLESQLVIAGLSWLARKDEAADAAVDAGWDLVVVDEAHHLQWSPESPSAEYQVAERLGKISPGMLLLTATPEHHGEVGHFARLRLLDPDRYGDFAEFRDESSRFRRLAPIADKLAAGGRLTKAERSRLAKTTGHASDGAMPEEPAELLAWLLDRLGTGRVLFRNTRKVVSGFPQRNALLTPVGVGRESQSVLEARVVREFMAEFVLEDEPVRYLFKDDPRVDWLADLLRTRKDEKFLLICCSRQKVLALESALRERINARIGLFHEAMPLIQRDRQAAWFSEPDGAQILMCSEIGSEGRNFQFAHHLILFDLPPDPETIEQRIGRLDRIGQRQAIDIHVPYVAGTFGEILARWYEEGLDAFSRCFHGGRAVSERFGARVRQLASDRTQLRQGEKAVVDALVAETRAFVVEWEKNAEAGRDRLLELHSFRATEAHALVESIAGGERSADLRDFLLRVFDAFGVRCEDVGGGLYSIRGDNMFVETFPGLPQEGMLATFERTSAVARDDLAFLTWDHPLVTGAIDLLLGSEKGNASIADIDGEPEVSPFLVEAVFVLEAIGAGHRETDRFLPPTPIRVVIDHRGNDVTESVPVQNSDEERQKGDVTRLREHGELLIRYVPELLERARAVAIEDGAARTEAARREVGVQFGRELDRLRMLRRINPAIREEEVRLAEDLAASLEVQVSGAEVRLDSVCLHWAAG